MYSVIILMAGSGTRMNLDVNKVLLPIKDKCIFEYSLDTFRKYADEIICVVSKHDYDKVKKIISSDVKIVIGGSTRGESVYNGLKECSNDYVLIHDAARPFISPLIIEKIINDVKLDEAVLTYLPVKDTIKYKEPLSTLNRDNLIAAVTPQGGPRLALVDSYAKALEEGYKFTDDISVLEKYCPECKVNLVLANEECFKVTTKLDYEMAKLIGEKL